MLAQNFKTPTDLGISTLEFYALAKVLGMLERQELPFREIHKPIKGNSFNMAVISHDAGCGTVACIMGWAQHIAGDRQMFDRYVYEDVQAPNATQRQLSELFLFKDEPNLSMMQGFGRTFSSVTDSEAAIALRNYLTHGEPRWEEALA